MGSFYFHILSDSFLGNIFINSTDLPNSGFNYRKEIAAILSILYSITSVIFKFFEMIYLTPRIPENTKSPLIFFNF